MATTDNLKCIGTKDIRIESEGGNNATTSGMLALFIATSREKESTLGDKKNARGTSPASTDMVANATTSGTFVMITDGNATFYSEMDLSNFKMTSEQMKGKDPISWCTQTLLERQEQSQSANTSDSHAIFSQEIDGIILKIRFTNNGIVRVVSSQSISKISSSSISFLQSISLSLKESTSTTLSLKIQLNKMERERNGWKDTATKLSTDHWKNEREQLMNRFLILLNRVKGDCRTANEKLSEESQRYAVLHEKHKRLELELNKGRELVVDHMDEHDINLFDDHEAKKLAAGDRVDDSSFAREEIDTTKFLLAKKRKANSSLGSSSNKSRPGVGSTSIALSTNQMGTNQSFLDTHASSNSGKTRKNPLTGSVEIWDTEGMFSDSSSD
jgi:hypothetical protein